MTGLTEQTLPARKLETICTYRDTGIAVLLCLLAAIVYVPTLNSEFIFDDKQSILDNESIRDLWPLSRSLFAERDSPTAGRPIVNFSFALNYAQAGLDPRVYRATNIVLHYLNALLLYFWLRFVFSSDRLAEHVRHNSRVLAVSITAIWLVHPIHIETVVYLSQRSELLVSFFLLAALLAHVQTWNQTRSFWAMPLTALLCWLGCLCKETMVVTPVLLIACDGLFLSAFPLIWRKRRLYYLALMSTWFIIGFVMSQQPRAQSVGFHLSVSPRDYFFTQCWNVLRYLYDILLPINVMADYGYVTRTTPDEYLPGLLFVSIYLGLTIYFVWKRISWSYWLLWSLALLAPTTSFIPIVTEMGATRRLYLPLVGVVALVVLGLSSTFGEKASRARILIPVSITCLILACLNLSLSRHYGTSLAYWQYSHQVHPESDRAVLNLMKSLRTNEKWQEAIEFAQQQVQQWPNNVEVWNEAGHLFRQLRMTEQAMTAYQRVLEIDPNYCPAYNNLGLVMASSQPQAAEELFRRSIDCNPRNLEARNSLANHCARTARFDEAISLYQQILALDPTFETARKNLAVTMQMKAESHHP